MSVKSEITKGVFWIAIAKYSGIFVSLGITAILARHVTPAAFGTMAIATVIMAFLDIFSDMGLGVAIVQFKDLTKLQIESLFSVGIVLAIVLTVTLYITSETVANYYNDSTLIPIIHWLCLCLFFNTLNIIPNGLMLKNKRFRAIAIRTLCFQIISGTGACVAALHGLGIYALLITPVVTSIGVFIFNFCNYPQRPVWSIDLSVIKRVWSYSMYQFLFSFINYFSRNVDKLIIGKYLSMRDLGFYDKSYRLMQMPLQNITFVITPVLHPILSSLQDNPKELANKNLRLTNILSQISFPLGIILFFCATPIIIIVFGENWKPAIPVFQILAISVPLQVVLSTSGSIYQSAGYTKHSFYCGVQSAICTVGAFIFAAVCFKTIEAIAWAWNFSLLLSFFFCYWLMNHFTFRSSAISFFIQFLPQLVNSTVTAGVVYLFLKLWTPVEPFVHIIWVLVITCITTLTMATLLRQYTFKSLISPISNIFLDYKSHR